MRVTDDDIHGEGGGGGELLLAFLVYLVLIPWFWLLVKINEIAKKKRAKDAFGSGCSYAAAAAMGGLFAGPVLALAVYLFWCIAMSLTVWVGYLDAAPKSDWGSYLFYVCYGFWVALVSIYSLIHGGAE